MLIEREIGEKRRREQERERRRRKSINKKKRKEIRNMAFQKIEREIAHGKRNKWEKGIKGKEKGIREIEEEKKKKKKIK